MVTAYSSEKQVVLVAINYTENVRDLKLDLSGFKLKKGFESYTTTSEKGVDMQFGKGIDWKQGVRLPGRGLVTVVLQRE
jgi:hypothetical protein